MLLPLGPPQHQAVPDALGHFHFDRSAGIFDRSAVLGTF
jgi:hypothetical protein